MFLAEAQLTNKAFTDAGKGRIRQSLTALVWLFDVENIRRHDGCNKWWRWLQLMFRKGWRGLHDSFDELDPLITQEICFKYFLNLAGILFR